MIKIVLDSTGDRIDVFVDFGLCRRRGEQRQRDNGGGSNSSFHKESVVKTRSYGNSKCKKAGFPASFGVFATELVPLLTLNRRVCVNLQRVVHVELNRMRSRAEARDFFHFECNVGVNHVIAEHATTGQELAVFVQIFQRLIE